MKFKDDYKYLSGWIHDYYCDTDGYELIFDINNSSYFECPKCHYKYNDKKRKRAWITKYRYKIMSELEQNSNLFLKDKNKDFLNKIEKTLAYYISNYNKFTIHDKEGNIYQTVTNLNTGKITSQGLNEAMITLNIINTIENTREYLDTQILDKTNKFFIQIYELLKPQITRIHNIDCYEICVIGMIGIITKNKELLDFAFNSKFSFYNQIQKGTTKNNFWYEGSFHYHLFVLKPILNLLIIAKNHNYKIPNKYYRKIKNMVNITLKLSFNNCKLPSPNDGWPNRKLKDYINVFEISNQIWKNEFTETINNINNNYNPNKNTKHYIDTGFSIIRNNFWNIFIKYKNKTSSHAHEDILNTEILVGNSLLTHDLSSSGYGSTITKEFYKKDYSHNIVITKKQEPKKIYVTLKNKNGITIKTISQNTKILKKLTIKNDKLVDTINIKNKYSENIDYFFHCNAKLLTKLSKRKVKNIKQYPYYTEIYKINTTKDYISLKWDLNKTILTSTINIKNKEIYLGKTPNNPNNDYRTTILIRSKEGHKTTFNFIWHIENEYLNQTY